MAFFYDRHGRFHDHGPDGKWPCLYDEDEAVPCAATMPNDMRRRSGRSCELDRGHTGSHASQYSAAGRKARMKRAGLAA